MLQVSSEQHYMLHNTAAGNNKNWCPLQTAGQLTGLYAARSTHTAGRQRAQSVSQGEVISSHQPPGVTCCSVLGYYCSVRPITVSPHNVLQHYRVLNSPHPTLDDGQNPTQTIFLICSLNLAFTRLFAAIIPPFFIICIHFCVNYDLHDFC